MSSPSLDAVAVAEAFGLGSLQTEPKVVASGWGGHNLLWRFDTSLGVFAVKQVHRELPADIETPLAIERAAYAGGVPMAQPVLSADGLCYKTISGTQVRCHTWVEGSAKTNEQVSTIEAKRMGAVMAHLHSLQIDAMASSRSPSLSSRDHWLALAGRVIDRRPSWASIIDAQVDDLVRVVREAEQHRSALDAEGVIGSHGDLNAHNVLFHNEKLTVVDWDGAHATWSRFERASFAVLWSQRTDGGYDIERASAFLRGYLDAGGVVEHADADALWVWLYGVAWWAEQNVRMAIDMSTSEQDENVKGLLLTVLDGARIVGERQELLALCFTKLGISMTSRGISPL